MRMRVQPEAFGIVEAPRILGRVLREVEFGCVLPDQNDGMLAYAAGRGLPMWSQNLLRRDGGIAEKAIRRHGVAPTVASRVDAGLRVVGQGFQQMFTSLVQAFVAQIDSSQFVTDSFRHCGTPCCFGRTSLFTAHGANPVPLGCENP